MYKPTPYAPGYVIGRRDLPLTVRYCILRIADAKAMGWRALQESWQQDLNNLLAKRAKPKEKTE